MKDRNTVFSLKMHKDSAKHLFEELKLNRQIKPAEKIAKLAKQ